MTIDGKTHDSDLIIHPDGRVEDDWIRDKGHELKPRDIQSLADCDCDVVVCGTGIHGKMQPDPEVERMFRQKGIDFQAAPTREAARMYNEQKDKARTAACFHLTC